MDLLESSDITINSNITIEDIIDILCISYKKSDTPSVNTMINNIIGTYNPYEQCDGNFDSIVLSDCQSVCIERIANYLMELNSLECSLNFNTYCVSGGHSSHNDYNKKVLKLFFLKIYLIQYFTNSGFENIFGFSYNSFKNNTSPSYCDNEVIYNNVSCFNSKWSNISTLDLIRDNSARSNIINFSCVYNTTNIISNSERTIILVKFYQEEGDSVSVKSIHKDDKTACESEPEPEPEPVVPRYLQAQL